MKTFIIFSIVIIVVAIIVVAIYFSCKKTGKKFDQEHNALEQRKSEIEKFMFDSLGFPVLYWYSPLTRKLYNGVDSPKPFNLGADNVILNMANIKGVNFDFVPVYIKEVCIQYKLEEYISSYAAINVYVTPNDKEYKFEPYLEELQDNPDGVLRICRDSDIRIFLPNKSYLINSKDVCVVRFTADGPLVVGRE